MLTALALGRGARLCRDRCRPGGREGEAHRARARRHADSQVGRARPVPEAQGEVPQGHASASRACARRSRRRAESASASRRSPARPSAVRNRRGGREAAPLRFFVTTCAHLRATSRTISGRRRRSRCLRRSSSSWARAQDDAWAEPHAAWQAPTPADGTAYSRDGRGDAHGRARRGELQPQLV